MISRFLLTSFKCDLCIKFRRDCFVKEGAPAYSRCGKCADQKKGCHWEDAKAIANKETPPSEVDKLAREKEKEMKLKPSEPQDPPGASSSKAKGTKRKSPHDPRESITSMPPINRAEVIVYRPQNRVPRPKIAPPPPSPSKSFDFVESPQISLFASSSSLEPPPSVVATTSSASPTSSPSFSLEVALLRSQLDTANENLRRERERSQQERERHYQEVRGLEEQFKRERQAYQDFIASLAPDHRS